VTIAVDDPLAKAVVAAVHTSDVEGLRGLLNEHPGLAGARLGARTLLHVATDWPGHFPNPWVSTWDRLTPLDAAQRNGFDDLVVWLRDRGGRSGEDF
jgi:hypothetical protein